MLQEKLVHLLSCRVLIVEISKGSGAYDENRAMFAPKYAMSVRHYA